MLPSHGQSWLVRSTLTLNPDGTEPSSRAMVTSYRIAPKEFHMVKHYVRMTNLVAGALRSDDRGVTSVEYGIMVALVAIAIIGAVTAMAGGLKNLFNTVTANL